MALPAWRSFGTLVSGIGNVTPGLPTGWAQDDIFLLVVETANEAVTAPAGYTAVTNSPVSNTNAQATRLSVFWKRATASESAPTITDPGDHVIAIIHAISGCPTSGNPWESTQASTTTSGTTHTITGLTTVSDDCLFVICHAHGFDPGFNDTTWVNSDWANSDLGSLTQRSNNTRTDGNGGGVSVVTGTKATAGAVGNTTVTVDASTSCAALVIALRAASLTETGSDTGTGTEGNATVQATVPSSDSRSATETQSISATRPNSDTASASETASVRVLVSDTGTGTEASPGMSASIPGSDSATGAETHSIRFSQSDTASAAESQSIAATLSGSDSATGTETQSVQQPGNPTGSDTGQATETTSISVTFTKTDSASGSETQSSTNTPSGTDSGSATETQSIIATQTRTDSISATESQSTSTPGAPTSSDSAQGTETVTLSATFLRTDAFSAAESQFIEQWSDWTGIVTAMTYGGVGSLVMGPATVYVADFGSLEPLDSAIGSAPSSAVWTDVGALTDGATLVVKLSFDRTDLYQNPENPMSRLKRRRISVETKMAEPTLTNLLYATNNGSIGTGSGFKTYTPAIIDRATPLTYRAVIIDGWAPGFNSNNRHKRRRIILRKCLSIDSIDVAYTPDKLTVFPVTWAVHRVDDVIAPFKIIDEI